MDKQNIAIISEERITELITELSYIQIVVDEKLDPISKSLDRIDENMMNTISSFDLALAAKAIEVLEKINIEKIQQDISNEIISKIGTKVNNINNLSQLSIEVEALTKSYESNFNIFEKTVNSFANVVESNRKNIQKIDRFFIVMSFFFGLIFHHLDFSFPIKVMKASLNMLFAYF